MLKCKRSGIGWEYQGHIGRPKNCGDCGPDGPCTYECIIPYPDDEQPLRVTRRRPKRTRRIHWRDTDPFVTEVPDE